MEAFKYVSVITTISVFTALFSIIFQAYLASNDLKRTTNILTSLMFLENNITKKTVDVARPKIAVGYGSCSDLFIKATSFLNYTDDLNGENLDVDEVRNEEEFLTSFAYYFQRGAAAERYTPNKDFFKKLVQLAKKHHEGEPRWALGGNAPVMGQRFYREGAEVLLGAEMSNKLRKHLLPEIVLSNDQEVEEDDIHFILEYKDGETWGNLQAPRANRYILHSDYNNPRLGSFDKLNENIKTFNPRLLVVSGLQLLDNYPFKEGEREMYIKKIESQLKQLPRTTLTHFEMASFVEPILVKNLIEYIFPYSDSLGMNEQELDNLCHMFEEGIVSIAAEHNPRVANTLDQMRTVFTYLYNDYIKNRKLPGRRPITRLHLHTLAHQAFLTVKDSDWQHTKQAAAKSSIRASKHVCGSEILNPESFSVILDDSFSTSKNMPAKKIELKESDAVSCWSETLLMDRGSVEVEFCVAPVLVCKRAIQTCGAGDNISAAGLILQI